MKHKVPFNPSNPLHDCQSLIFKLSLVNCSLHQFKQLMLKLDPEDSDADMDDLDRSENNKQTPTKQSAQQPMMPQVDFESSIDQLASGGAGMMQPMVMVGGNHAQNIPTNLNNVSAFVVQNQYNNNSNSNQTRREPSSTPAGKGRPKGTPKKPATAKKASAAAGKKKKRRISSSEEESDFNSDSDY